MENLSANAMEIVNCINTERLYYHSEYFPLMQALNKLAAYEDTGLNPDTVSNIRDIVLGVNGDIDHLRELVQAEKDGRLVVLPCKDDKHCAKTIGG